jgi:hypothetical protein
MMQGEFQEHPLSACDFIRNSFNERKSPSEFFKFGSFSLPVSVDEAFLRSKTNIPKFLFYYICIASVAMLFVFLTKFIIIIPLSICAVGYYLSFQNFNISGIDIKPQHIFYACIGILVLLSLISSNIVTSYLVLIAFLSIATIFILLHACLLDVSGDTENENI